MLKKKIKHSEIAEMIGVSKPAVDKISKAYKDNGMSCVKEKVRGRKVGEKRQLTPEQEKETRQTLIDKLLHTTQNSLPMLRLTAYRADVCNPLYEAPLAGRTDRHQRLDIFLFSANLSYFRCI